MKFFNIKQETIDNIVASDFCCGYMAAIFTFFIILFFLLVLRFLFFLFFRTKRCSKIVVDSKDGDLIVTRSAITAVVRKELEGFPQIELKKLVLFKKGKAFSMKIFCHFERTGSGLPEIVQELKPHLKEVMKQIFGIETISDITICIEQLEQDSDGPDVPGSPTGPQIYTSNADSGF